MNNDHSQAVGAVRSDVLDRRPRDEEWEEFQRTINWCADMELHTNAKLSRWTDEWLLLNFGEGVINEDLLEMSAGQIRRLICVAYAKGKFSKEEPVEKRVAAERKPTATIDTPIVSPVEIGMSPPIARRSTDRPSTADRKDSK